MFEKLRINKDSEDGRTVFCYLYHVVILITKQSIKKRRRTRDQFIDGRLIGICFSFSTKIPEMQKKKIRFLYNKNEAWSFPPWKDFIKAISTRVPLSFISLHFIGCSSQQH